MLINKSKYNIKILVHYQSIFVFPVLIKCMHWVYTIFFVVWFGTINIPIFRCIFSYFNRFTNRTHILKNIKLSIRSTILLSTNTFYHHEYSFVHYTMEITFRIKYISPKLINWRKNFMTVRHKMENNYKRSEQHRAQIERKTTSQKHCARNINLKSCMKDSVGSNLDDASRYCVYLNRTL